MAFKGSGYMKGVKKKRYEPLVSRDKYMETASAIVKVEETPTADPSLQQDAVSDMTLLSNVTESEEFVRIDMPADLFVGSSSSNSNSSSRGLPPKPKSKFHSGTLVMEEVAILALGGLQPHSSERYPFLGSTSLTRREISICRATSIPASAIQPLNLNSTDDCYIALNSNGVGELQPIHRSRSVPVNYTDGTMREDHVRVLRVVPIRRMAGRNSTSSRASTIQNDEENEDDITEEEAVCRICLEELGEELETFKLECNCRGELALVHRGCSQRWFNTRGNRTCEICRKEVKNITVKIWRMPVIDLSSLRHLQQPPMVDADRLWQEFPILVVASIVGYFVSVKLLRKSKGGSEDIDDPYGIPSSCILGLITALIATAFAERKHVWIYALAQYIGFTVFAQIFNNLFHMKPIPTLVLSMILGMGISRGTGPVYSAIKKWRNQFNSNPQAGEEPTELQPTQENAESHDSESNDHLSNA